MRRWNVPSYARAFSSFHGHSLLLEPLRQKPPLVLDLGANRGGFARALSAQVGCDYYLVEANPTLADQLRSATPFRVAQQAVGAAEASVHFNIAVNDEASSVCDLPPASAYNAVLASVVEVEQVPLQGLITAHGRVVDVLKLDIEGAEVVALNLKQAISVV